MNKTIAIGIISALAISLGAIAYIKSRPEPVSVCDSLLWKIAEAKTEAEKSFAEQNWKNVCDGK
jgi:hypothetical protein